jgi:hypothetical protein
MRGRKRAETDAEGRAEDADAPGPSRRRLTSANEGRAAEADVLRVRENVRRDDGDDGDARGRRGMRRDARDGGAEGGFVAVDGEWWMWMLVKRATDEYT